MRGASKARDREDQVYRLFSTVATAKGEMSCSMWVRRPAQIGYPILASLLAAGAWSGAQFLC